MPWTQARDFLAAVARLQREELMQAAIAARAAQAEEKSWRAWVEEIVGRQSGR